MVSLKIIPQFQTLGFIQFLFVVKLISDARVYVIKIVYSKAFYRVNHYFLLQKLLGLEIHGDLYRWIASYVKNRHQITVVNGFPLFLTGIVSGVPQGWHIRSLLFNFNINVCFKNSYFVLLAVDMNILNPYPIARICKKKMCILTICKTIL